MHECENAKMLKCIKGRMNKVEFTNDDCRLIS